MIRHTVIITFVLYVLLAEAVLLAACWRLFGPRRGQRHLSAAYASAVLFGQALIPLSWLGLKAGWVMLSEVQRADALAILHFSFVAPVVLAQVLIVAGGLLGWGWVRNYTFRVVHLIAIAFVVIQASVGHECFVNEFERELRGDQDDSLHNPEGASAVGWFCNRMVYQPRPVSAVLVQYAVFAAVVIASWYLVRPRWPAALERED